ncbi:DUF6270 domain-containing protein, partial [Isoptericola sp. NPDC060282]
MTLRVLVVGSCVTRDVFATFGADDGVDLAGYFARTSLASAFAERSNARYDPARESSPFRRRMVEADLTKVLSTGLTDVAWDLLVVDLIDERFDLIVDGSGGVATRSNELLTGYTASSEDRIVQSGSAEHFERWTAGFQRFVEIVEASSRSADVRINAPRWATVLEDGTPLPSANLEYIARSNLYQDRLVGQAQASSGWPVWSY